MPAAAAAGPPHPAMPIAAPAANATAAHTTTAVIAAATALAIPSKAETNRVAPRKTRYKWPSRRRGLADAGPPPRGPARRRALPPPRGPRPAHARRRALQAAAVRPSAPLPRCLAHSPAPPAPRRRPPPRGAPGLPLTLPRSLSASLSSVASGFSALLRRTASIFGLPDLFVQSGQAYTRTRYSLGTFGLDRRG